MRARVYLRRIRESAYGGLIHNVGCSSATSEVLYHLLRKLHFGVTVTLNWFTVPSPASD